MLHRIVLFVVRVLIATSVAVIVLLLPPPELPAWVGQVQMPLTVFLLVCYCGKLLYDTLFYNHYQP